MSFMNMAKKLKDMRGQMKQAQAVLAAQTVTGKGGRDAVVVEMNGAMELKSIKIDPKVVEKNDVDQLEKLVKEAVGDALKRAQKVAAAQMSKLTGGMGGMNPFG